MKVLNQDVLNGKALKAFSLTELLVVLVIIGILVLVAMPNLMPLISRAKATEAQQQLTFLHSLEKSYFYTYSRYSDDLEELGFEQTALVTDGGNANYRIEVAEAARTASRLRRSQWLTLTRTGSLMFGRLIRTRT